MTKERERRIDTGLSGTLTRALGSEEPDPNARNAAMAQAVLEDAIHEHASDVHLDPGSRGYQVRMRIDGAMVDTLVLTPDLGRQVVRTFKAHADLDSGFTLRPLDGRAEFNVRGRVTQVRVTTAPTVRGEKLALRLLPDDSGSLKLEQLGLSEQAHAELEEALCDASGMILVAGPTGAGKTTTLYGLLHDLKRSNRSIVTIEDPVEQVIEGLTQIQVNTKQGLTFAEGVRGLMRLDPDILMMGEMRDTVSARAGLEAADSGHVFLSSLHARDGAGTITTLRNLGLADHEIAASVDLIVAQRLVRRLCVACRRQEAPSPEERRWLMARRLEVPERTWRAVGCAQCGKSGYRGRVGIFEVHRLRERDAEAVFKHLDERTIRRRLRRSGTPSMLEDHLQKVVRGLTTVAELEDVGGLEFICAKRRAADRRVDVRERDGQPHPRLALAAV